MRPKRKLPGTARAPLISGGAAAVRWLVALALAVLVYPIDALQAAGDGPRVHGPLPIGFNGALLNGSSLQDANRTFDPSLIRPSRFDTNIVGLAYMRTFEVRKRHVLFMGILRGGQATRQSIFEGGREVKSSNGLADPYIGFSVNLFGLPPLDHEAYRDFQPGLKVNFLLAAIPPLGEYDVTNPVNLGANRWSVRLGLPVTQSFTGFRGLPGTLELIPDMLLFSENKDSNLEQDPLFNLEGHVTQNFTQRTWGSLGLLYSRGGKTTINGLPGNGSQESLSLSATLGINFSPRWALQLRFGQSVAQNEFGLVGKIYQFKLARFY